MKEYINTFQNHNPFPFEIFFITVFFTYKSFFFVKFTYQNSVRGKLIGYNNY